MKLPENEIICGDWHNCYDDSWQGIIVPEAFAHPAKMARGLTNRIFKHALSESWIKPGDVVVDPFGGIGSTGIIGASLGLRVICVELEQKFVDLGKQNFELNRKAFEVLHFGHSYQPRIIQGDSRKLSEVIAGADCVVGSPPYAEQVIQKRDIGKSNQGATQGKHAFDEYGQTPGQLGAMKPGNIDCVVGSPPFAEPNMQPTGKHQGVRSDYPNMGKKPEFRSETEGNLASMKPGSVEAIISSPPYAETLKGDGTQKETAAESRAKRVTAGGSLGQSQRTQGYGSKGNLGNLKPGEVEAIISSPPFEDSLAHKMKDGTLAAAGKNEDGTNRGGSLVGTDYGDAAGNIGNEKGETFWQAARQIVSECHKILKPGGHAIWVVKAFVRKGAIVDFPGDWRRLCESVGFKTVHTHHAMLVKETRHDGLFEEIVETKERKSFFRRLAEKKGSPKIDYEVVLCTKKSSDNT